MPRKRATIRRCCEGRDRRGGPQTAAVLALAVAALALGACSVPVADLPVIGLPAGTPGRPADPPAYPGVHEMPSARSDPTLTAEQQAKIEDDLKAARDRQAGQAKAAERSN